MSGAFQHLLEPIQIGPKTVRNRALVTAHVPGLEKDGLASDAFIAYQRARAHGGAGLQISGSSTVHATGSVGAGRSLNNTKAGIVESYKRLADAIHEEGGHFLVQLGHAAASVNDQDADRPLWAPSAVPSQLVREMPEVMTQAMIDEIIAAYASAAERVRAGGLDGVEILGAFGLLPAAFLSPLTNKREDDYGGSPANRLRFLLEVIDAVRAAAGPDLIVGLRMPGDERTEGGLTQADMEAFAPMLTASGKLDYLNVVAGTNYDRIMRMEHWPPTPAPHGLYVPLAAAIKTKVEIPVFTSGRITNPALAESILAKGEADMVGMTRAHIADPDLVKKVAQNRPEDVRPCVGANLCISNATEGKVIRCLYNPEAAREHEWGPQEAAGTAKRVAVVGGGPAGLEAARVAAERGHQVVLYEAGAELGGQFRLWAKAPQTQEFGRSIAWYEGQLTKLQVQVRRNAPVTPEMAGELDADCIILATGSKPAVPLPIAGQDPDVITQASPWEILEAPPSGQHVLVIDEGGGRAGLAAADVVLDHNRVTIVSTDFTVGEMVNPNIRTPLYKRLLGGNVVLRPCEEVVRAEGKTVVTRNIYSGQEARIDAVDCVVNWRGNHVVNDLSDTLQGADVPVKVIGDCRAPRHVHTAIAEGALAGRSI